MSKPVCNAARLAAVEETLRQPWPRTNGQDLSEPSDDEADAIEQWQDACDKSPPRLRVVRDGE